MGDVLEAIDDKLADWLTRQPMFFVATAPLAGDGLVNCSPKGSTGSFVVLDSHTVAYLDLTGSGIETIAHLRENGRIVLMFCAFEGRPNIVRLHGTGRPVVPEDDAFAELVAKFPEHPGIRSVIVVNVARIADSCGYAVPLMDYVADREVLDLHNAKKGPEALVTYRATRNAESLDGLPGLPTR
jgi:Pyridoxamine 5'-phosphate oxidase